MLIDVSITTMDILLQSVHWIEKFGLLTLKLETVLIMLVVTRVQLNVST